MTYRRQHEKALAKIVDKIADAIIASEKETQAVIDALKLESDTKDKLAKMIDYSSRRYQVRILKREIKNILIKSQNLLVATIVPKLDN